MAVDWAERVQVPDNLQHDSLESVTAHRPLFQRIIAEQPGSVLEAGCGTGKMSYFLARFTDAQVTAIDHEQQIIERLKQQNDVPNLDYRVADGFNLSDTFDRGQFDIVFHQGVVEHFSNSQIRNFISQNLAVADKTVFSVPSYYYPEQDAGDERLMTAEQWEQIIGRDMDVSVSTLYYGKRLPKLVAAVRNGNISYLWRMLHGFNRPQLLVEVAP